MPAYCTNCAAALDPGVKFCAACGTPVEVPAPPHLPAAPARTEASPAGAYSAPAPASTGRRYPALRIVAIVLKVAAVFWLIVGVLGFIMALAMGSDLPAGMGAASGIYGFLCLLTAVYFAVLSWAGAELLHVFMDIEENTRRTAAK